LSKPELLNIMKFYFFVNGKLFENECIDNSLSRINAVQLFLKFLYKGILFVITR